MKSDYLENVFEELKHSSYPIFIWGAGSMSLEVEKRLTERGISFVGKFINTKIDRAHIVDNPKEIFSLQDIEEKYKKINVVMGHGHYEKADEIKLYPFINQVYIIPNPYPQYKGPDLEYVKYNQEKVEYIKKCLADDKSRYVLEKYIAVWTTNDISHLLASDVCVSGIYGLEELNISTKERFVDIGAWEGDTIDSFLKKTKGNYEYIYAVEPDPNSFEKLESRFHKKENISLIQCGLGEKVGELYLGEENSQSAFLKKEATKRSVKVMTIDTLFGEKSVSLIKIFVPFMFLDILKGGESVIKRNRPRLIVNVSADNKCLLYDTVKWITDLGLDYKLALRFDFPMPTRMCLYAYHVL